MASKVGSGRVSINGSMVISPQMSKSNILEKGTKSRPDSSKRQSITMKGRQQEKPMATYFTQKRDEERELHHSDSKPKTKKFKVVSNHSVATNEQLMSLQKQAIQQVP